MHINIKRNWTKFQMKGMLGMAKAAMDSSTTTEVEKIQLEIVACTLEGIIENWIPRIED